MDQINAGSDRKQDIEQLLQELDDRSENTLKSLFRPPDKTIKTIDIHHDSSRNQSNIHEYTKVFFIK